MSQQRVACLAAAALVAVLGVTVSKATAPRIEPGAEEWVIAADITPFVVTDAAGGEGGGGVIVQYFDEHPSNGGGGARYRDEKRNMFVEVRVRREVRTHYLDHFIEAPYRDNRTGRFHEPNTSLITLFGQPVLFYCDKPPNCTDRTYVWRSGEDLVLTISAGTYPTDITPGVHWGPYFPTPAPVSEPTEILAAYLGRYPSSLTETWAEPTWEWATSAERAREHVRTSVALELAAAKFWLALIARDGVQPSDLYPLRRVEDFLQEFAVRRQLLGRAPDPRETERRLWANRQRPLAERLATLQTIAAEQQAWWDDNVGTPIHVPELPPPPTPVPGAAPTPPATP